MTGVSVLDREMYSEAEAARLLRVPQSTLNYWLEGGQRRGKLYRPVIRPEPRGTRAPVTWAEFIEAGLLRQYRDRNVSMAELRAFIDLLRARYGVPYPLADGCGRGHADEVRELGPRQPRRGGRGRDREDADGHRHGPGSRAGDPP